MILIPARQAGAEAGSAAPDAPGAVIKRGGDKTVSLIARRIFVVSVLAVMCAANAACVSDPGAQAKSQSGGQLRYYGGPKSPMWQTQQVGHEQS
jgi:hypothetical protein